MKRRIAAMNDRPASFMILLNPVQQNGDSDGILSLIMVERTPLKGLLAEGLLGAARLAPSGSPFGRSTSLRDVVEPGMFYVGGSNLQRRTIAAEKRNLDALQGICRLRDSNPRPTVYKTVALPLC